MKVNSDKSKVMLFNLATKINFKPTLSLDPGNNLNFEESSNLLGIIVKSNLKWNLNTDSKKTCDLCKDLDVDEIETQRSYR